MKNGLGHQVNETVLCFTLYKPSVCFKALSIAFIGSLPITRSTAISVMVAKLSVITTESVSNPEFFPSDDSNFTSTRLGCLARNVLLVIIATMTCGKSVSKSSACTINGAAWLSANRNVETEPKLYHRV